MCVWGRKRVEMITKMAKKMYEQCERRRKTLLASTMECVWITKVEKAWRKFVAAGEETLKAVEISSRVS